MEQLFDQLETHYATFPGYVLGFRYGAEAHSQAPTDEVGRLAVWESHQAMDKAATNDHTMVLRSEINLLLVSGEHEELVHDIQGTPHNLPSVR